MLTLSKTSTTLLVALFASSALAAPMEYPGAPYLEYCQPAILGPWPGPFPLNISVYNGTSRQYSEAKLQSDPPVENILVNSNDSTVEYFVSWPAETSLTFLFTGLDNPTFLSTKIVDASNQTCDQSRLTKPYDRDSVERNTSAVLNSTDTSSGGLTRSFGKGVVGTVTVASLAFFL